MIELTKPEHTIAVALATDMIPCYGFVKDSDDFRRCRDACVSTFGDRVQALYDDGTSTVSALVTQRMASIVSVAKQILADQGIAV